MRQRCRRCQVWTLCVTCHASHPTCSHRSRDSGTYYYRTPCVLRVARSGSTYRSLNSSNPRLAEFPLGLRCSIFLELIMSLRSARLGLEEHHQDDVRPGNHAGNEPPGAATRGPHHELLRTYAVHNLIYCFLMLTRPSWHCFVAGYAAGLSCFWTMDDGLGEHPLRYKAQRFAWGGPTLSRCAVSTAPLFLVR